MQATIYVLGCGGRYEAGGRGAVYPHRSKVIKNLIDLIGVRQISMVKFGFLGGIGGLPLGLIGRGLRLFGKAAVNPHVGNPAVALFDVSRIDELIVIGLSF